MRTNTIYSDDKRLILPCTCMSLFSIDITGRLLRKIGRDSVPRSLEVKRATPRERIAPSQVSAWLCVRLPNGTDLALDDCLIGTALQIVRGPSTREILKT